MIQQYFFFINVDVDGVNYGYLTLGIRLKSFRASTISKFSNDLSLLYRPVGENRGPRVDKG